MLHDFPFYLGIIVLIVLLILLANKIKVAYPILLVLGGLAASLVPGVPRIRIDPELIFIIFLPPLLYEAAWSISWKELWKWRRIVTSFAFIVVLLTATAVALASNYFIPGFSLAMGFLLGGIVSPPDAVSAGAIMKFVKVPARFQTIVEGESLFNDASSLIVFRFALVAVGTGQFVWQEAALSFGWMVVAGVGTGLLLAYLFYKAHKFLPTNAEMDIVLTLVAPYFMYIVAEAVHCSGVLAVVSGGLFLARRQHRFLSSDSRIKGYSVWQSFSFILNGLVFILIGLDLPEISDGLEGVSTWTAIGYGAIITLVLVVVRMLAAYGAVLTTFIMRNFINVAERHPGYKTPFLLGWAGMRGVVSLAAALSIPRTLADGTPFPGRNLILFITFVVILLTLVIQGLTLPYFIRKIPILHDDEEVPGETHYYALHYRLNQYSSDYAATEYGEAIELQPALQYAVAKWRKGQDASGTEHLNAECKAIMLKIINQQRAWLLEWNDDEELDEEHIRRHLYRLDLEEERLKYM
ncbi:MAG: Na+/H+ antiporter [Flavipsychrobacter sp.]|nr:Na+/H+ antiporter [Flavipsychrobacter sp.]